MPSSSVRPNRAGSSPPAPAVIGIDLGTTNCALACTRGDAVELFPIPQLVNPGEVREELLLPSFIFLEGDTPIVGVLAQKRGLENVGRLVASAKSWLCHAGVDRESRREF
jgi:molecular chaperone DnaK (HSP70)